MKEITKDKKTKHLPPVTLNLYPIFTLPRQSGIEYIPATTVKTKYIPFQIRQEGSIEGKALSMVLPDQKLPTTYIIPH